MKILNYVFTMLLLLLSSGAFSQATDSVYIKANFIKSEHYIEMRDGVKLYTIIYTPKDNSKTYPILMKRTCYNISGNNNYRLRSPSSYIIRDGYILVYQDVRGRYMSEGTFDNMRPLSKGTNAKTKTVSDESSDTYDTVEWLTKNVKGNNGNVGILGTSYPGHYSAIALIDAHPALKASSPQAPISDFFFDDFHHHGAFLQSYTAAFPVFGYQKDSLTRKGWYAKEMMRIFKNRPVDGYQFYLDLGPLKNVTDKYHYDNFFWQQTINHPNYDEFWQKRSILPKLKDITPAVMVVGGWFDAEDLFGPLNIYKTIEKRDSKATNTIVMGPWTHGAWGGAHAKAIVNDIYFGDSISTFYQQEMELAFFNHYLKGDGEMKLPEAYMFDTGSKEWKKYDVWPPKDMDPISLTFGKNEALYVNEAVKPELKFDYVSDPLKPVPYRSVTEGMTFTPRNFITDDQRHASYRPDVLTFKTEVLDENVTIAGEILAKLMVSMTGSDADFIVKLIDVYPDNHKQYEHNPKNIKMGGYQQLVRHEVFRGRFRESYVTPEPFEPNVISEVDVPLQDICHTFKKGHRMMIQIHSTWFPYIDRNPQKYVENIYKADAIDFTKSAITIYGSSVVKVGGAIPEINEIMTKRMQ